MSQEQAGAGKKSVRFSEIIIGDIYRLVDAQGPEQCKVYYADFSL